jgi:hypothetical protein
MITNIDIEKACEKYNIPLVVCTTKDLLKDTPRQSGNYILNLQNDKTVDGSVNPGTHWMGLHIDTKKNKCVYFDSFGMAPPIEIRDYCRGIPMRYSDMHIQNEESSVCGYYVLCWCWYMTHLKKNIPDLFNRMTWWLSQFHNDPEKNRKILEKLMEVI